jgi:hypothetical protein
MSDARTMMIEGTIERLFVAELAALERARRREADAASRSAIAAQIAALRAALARWHAAHAHTYGAEISALASAAAVGAALGRRSRGV